MELKYNYVRRDLEDARGLLDTDVDIDRRISRVLDHLIEAVFQLESSTSSTKSVPLISQRQHDGSAAP